MNLKAQKQLVARTLEEAVRASIATNNHRLAARTHQMLREWFGLSDEEISLFVAAVVDKEILTAWDRLVRPCCPECCCA